jgi:hypothetical protein
VAGGFSLGFLLEEIIEDGPVVLEIIVWHGKPARCADLMDVDDDDATSAGYGLHFLGLNELVEARRTIFDHSTVAKEPHDPRRTLESVQHDGDTVVARLVDVRNRLVAAAGELLVPERLAVEHAEVLASFGRDIDVAFTGQRR